MATPDDVPPQTLRRSLDVVATYLARTLMALFVLLGVCELALAVFGPDDPRAGPSSLEGLPYVVQTRYLGYSHMAGVVFRDDVLGHRNMPNATYGADVLAAADVPAEVLGGYSARELALHTDDWGFVTHGGDGRPPSERRPGERLVLCFGGSTMVGWGAAPRESIPAHLERLLTAPDAPVRVINAGVIAYHSMQEFLYFALELVHLQPDAVVFLDGFNDGYGEPDAPRYLPTLDASSAEPSGAALWLSAFGTLAPRTVALLGRRGGAGEDSRAEFFARQRSQYHVDMEHTLRAAVAVAEENHIAVVLALQPDIYSKAVAARTDHESQLLEVFREHGMFREGREQRQAGARALYARLAERFARRRDVRVVDLLGAFDDLHVTTYFDDGHYTAAGNARLASRIAASLRPLLDRTVTPGESEPVERAEPTSETGATTPVTFAE